MFVCACVRVSVCVHVCACGCMCVWGKIRQPGKEDDYNMNGGHVYFGQQKKMEENVLHYYSKRDEKTSTVCNTTSVNV